MKQAKIIEEEVIMDEPEDSSSSGDSGTEISIDSLSKKKLGEKFEVPNYQDKVFEISDVKLVALNQIRKTTQGKDVRNVLLKIFFKDDLNTYTNLGGIVQFQSSNGDWGEPSFDPKAENATARLFRDWLKFRGLKEEEVSRRDFFGGLKGLSVKLDYVEVTNPTNKQKIKKNQINSFV